MHLDKWKQRAGSRKQVLEHLPGHWPCLLGLLIAECLEETACFCGSQLLLVSACLHGVNISHRVVNTYITLAKCIILHAPSHTGGNTRCIALTEGGMSVSWLLWDRQRVFFLCKYLPPLSPAGNVIPCYVPGICYIVNVCRNTDTATSPVFLKLLGIGFLSFQCELQFRISEISD